MLHGAVNDFLAILVDGEEGQRGGSANTYLAYGNDLHQFCSFLVTQRVLAWQNVTAEHVTGYLHQPRGERSYAERTVARKLCALKAFFRYLRRRGLLSDDPAAQLSLSSAEKPSPRILSSAQRAHLFQQINADTPAGLRDLAMYHVLYSSSMYVAELVSLNVCHFDQQRLCIHHPGPGDGECERKYPLSKETAGILALYLEKSRPVFIQSDQEEALFLNHHGRRLSRQGLWLIMKEHARSIGCTELSPGTLRRSFSSAELLWTEPA